jgi:hypothetical protein
MLRSCVLTHRELGADGYGVLDRTSDFGLLQTVEIKRFLAKKPIKCVHVNERIVSGPSDSDMLSFYGRFHRKAAVLQWLIICSQWRLPLIEFCLFRSRVYSIGMPEVRTNDRRPYPVVACQARGPCSAITARGREAENRVEASGPCNALRVERECPWPVYTLRQSLRLRRSSIDLSQPTILTMPVFTQW